MKVLKFGGTSVGTVNSLRNVKSIVEACDEPVIVVVSALGGLTDCLTATARDAAEGCDGYIQSFDGIVRRHHDIIDGIVPVESRAHVRAQVDPLLDELGRVYAHVREAGELAVRTLDCIVSYGELMSSHIVTAIINGAVRFDSRNFIKTRDSFDKHLLDNEATSPLIHKYFDAFAGRVAVVPGFISTDSRQPSVVTNLGRGGSDYTAAILAAELNARVLEIWTDVDGFMTADPRVIESAYVIDCMSFVEAMELCNFGAKVIYPPTIYPVFHKNIPIVIKNTFNPQAPGTLVSDDRRDYVASSTGRHTMKGISSINDTCLVTVAGFGMVGMPGISSRIFNTLNTHGVSVFMVNQASGENNTSFAVRNESADIAVQALNEEFSVELATGAISSISARSGLATVAVVGENMKDNTAVAGRLFNTLSRNGIGVTAFAHGASGTNISFVVDLAALRNAMGLIHECFFVTQPKVFNIYILGDDTPEGIGLTERINHHQPHMLSHSGVMIQVAGQCGAKTMPSDVCRLVATTGSVTSVFVDCSLNKDTSDVYRRLLAQKINVVSLSGTSDDNALHQLANENEVTYITCSESGYDPVVESTIHRLKNAGDAIMSVDTATVADGTKITTITTQRHRPLTVTTYMSDPADNLLANILSIVN